MSYQTIKEGIGKMLASKGFTDSLQVFNFNDESDQSIDKKFCLQRPEMLFDADGVEFMSNLVRPVSTYKLLLGFKLSTQKMAFDYDVSQNLLDTIVAYFNNPTNYIAYCIKLKTRSIKSEVVDEHLEAVIELEVLDNITLT